MNDTRSLGGRAILGAGLHQQVLEMLLDRSRADAEDLGDLAIGLACAEPAEHFLLAAREPAADGNDGFLALVRLRAERVQCARERVTKGLT